MAIKVVSSVLDDNIKIVDDIAKANIKQIGGQSPAGGGGGEEITGIDQIDQSSGRRPHRTYCYQRPQRLE